MKVLVSAILDKVTTTKDGSIRLQFETQELSGQKCADLFSLRNQIGYLVFASEDETEVEIPPPPKPEG